MELQLGELAQMLSSPTEAFEVVEASGPLRYASTIDASYVEPRLRVEQSLPDNSAIVVVSAPAATGKSAAARALAAMTRAPILDLANVQVGQGTLSGTVIAALGYEAGPRFLAGLESGSQLLIIDALDEAELRSGERNFTAFLSELEKFGRAGPSAPTIVLFGRSETIEWVRITFDQDAVPSARLRLDYFDRGAAEEFLDLKLESIYERRRESAVHRSHVGPYQQARDRLFALVYEILDLDGTDPWESEELRRFLGYAPVLEALSEYLAVSNFGSLIADLNEAATNPHFGNPIRLLVAIVDGLLLREQAKLVTQLREPLRALEPTWDEFAKIYTPEEQCSRLIARVDSGGLVPLPLSLPETLREDYESAMTTVLSNHPFLDGPRKYVNVVFRDYLYAHALRRIEPSEGIIRCVRRKLRSPDYLASPLLAAFLHAQTEERQTGDVAGEDVAAVVESARARSPEEDAGFALFAGGSRETGVLLVDMGGGRQLAFRVSDVRHATLPGKTANAFVVSGGVVELLSRNGSIVIGPNAFIWAEDGVILDAADVMLVTGDQGSVVIDTSEIMGPPEQAVRKVGSGQVLVVWEGAHYPWIEHSGERPSFDSPVDAYETYVELRRIVTRFKGGSAGTSPCILRDFLDQFVLKDNTRAQAVFDVLVEMQVITKDHKFFYLDLGALEHAGINYVDLRANRVGDGLRKFVNEILKRRA